MYEKVVDINQLASDLDLHHLLCLCKRENSVLTG